MYTCSNTKNQNAQTADFQSTKVLGFNLVIFEKTKCWLPFPRLLKHRRAQTSKCNYVFSEYKTNSLSDLKLWNVGYLNLGIWKTILWFCSSPKYPKSKCRICIFPNLKHGMFKTLTSKITGIVDLQIHGSWNQTKLNVNFQAPQICKIKCWIIISQIQKTDIQNAD